MSVEVVYEGHACSDCIQVIANNEWSGIEDPGQHLVNIDATDLRELGYVLMACGEDCEGEFRTDACDFCGSTLAGDRHPIAVLA